MSELVILRLEGERAVAAEARDSAGGSRPLALRHRRAADAFAALLGEHPGARLAWLDVRVERWLEPVGGWPAHCRSALEVPHLSGAQGAHALAATLAYVDFDSPYLLPAPADRPFGTWLISPLAGCASAAALAAVGFEPRLPGLAAALFDLGYRGQRLGLRPRWEPALLRAGSPALPAACRRPLGARAQALLVRRLYGRHWLPVWALCGLLAARRPRLLAAARAFFAAPAAAAEPDRLAPFQPPAATPPAGAEVDAVIPTLGRPQHLRTLLEDLAGQRLRPRTVVVVVQPAPGLDDHLGDLDNPAEGRLPFALTLERVPWQGACRARNLGLEAARSAWVLLLDDDVRLDPEVVERLLAIALGHGVDAVIADVRQPGQAAPAPAPPHPWPAFASGAALVSRRALDLAGGFDEAHEGGFGEDFELGVRLRLAGFEVLRAPAVSILHLKAPAGGFRQPRIQPWHDDPVPPVPSPTVLYSRRKHQPPSMHLGYRVVYTVKRLAATPVYRWPLVLPRIQRRWRSAERWCDRLLARSSAASAARGSR